MSKLRLAALIALSSLALHCAPGGDSSDLDDDAEESDEDLKNKGGNQKWIYGGMMPALEAPAITVSLKGHTLRITGQLPAGHSAPLPFYAERGEGNQVSIVYPIATGATAKGPGLYPDIAAIPYVPSTSKAAWGGFPFLEYNHKRGLAMHGPITSADGEWQLIRGPVSHGCNRMQGEHVTELAHLLGIDMTVPHKIESIKLPVTVNVIEPYDALPSGALVDVDFVTHKNVVRPTGNVKMFRTWDSRDFPRWVCAYDKNRALGAAHCDYMDASVLDAQTGLPPSGSACGAVTYEGSCEGNVLQYCDQSLKVMQCSAGETCGYDAQNKYFNCL